MTKRPSIGLVSPGVGRADRGYEKFAIGLYSHAVDHLPMTLFAGAPVNVPCVSVGGLGRDDTTTVLLSKLGRDRYFWEGLSFGWRVWPLLRRGSFDVVHYSEPVLNLLFRRLEKHGRFRPVRLFSHGVNMDPEHCLDCHHLHQVSEAEFERARVWGVPVESMTLLGYGQDTSPFLKEADRESLRSRFGIPADACVALAVAAVNSAHKRVDKLVEAVSQIPGLFLVVCGKPEEPWILREAEGRLAGRFAHLYVPPGDVVDVLGMADFFVLASLQEGAPHALVEAAVAGLPLLVHRDCAVRQMLDGAETRWADLSNEVSLVQALQESIADLGPARARAASQRHEFAAGHDWAGLVPKYVEMYKRVAALPPTTIAERMGLR